MDNTVQIIFELLKKGSGGVDAADDLRKVDTASKSAAASLEGFLKKTLAFAAIEETVRRSVDAFLALENSVSKLDGALRSTGQFSAAYSAQIQEMGKAIAETTNFSKVELNNLSAVLVAFGAKKENLKQLTMTILDLATILGRDLPAATGIFTAALQGQFEPAQRALRIRFDENANAAQNFETMMKRVTEISGGQAKEAFNGLGANLERQKKQWEELQQSVGKFALESLDVVIKKFKELRDLQNANPMMGHLLGTTPADQAALDAHASHGRTPPIVGTTPLPDLLLNTPSGRASISGGFDVHNIEQEKTALLELNKLRVQLSTAGLEGIDRERAELLVRDKEESDSIIKNANLARISNDEKLQRMQELDKATLAGLDLIERRRQEQQDRRSIDEMKDSIDRDKMEKDLRDQATAAVLKDQDLEVFNATTNHEKRMQQIREMQFENVDDYLKLMELEQTLSNVEQDRIAKAHDAAYQLSQDWKDIAKQGEQAFASGLAGAIVDAFQEGDKAFQKFAANFLRQIANMILQALILRAIQSALGGLSTGGQRLAANGGAFMAAGGWMGSVSAATYLPKFNVVAGEAGRELLTVLARPQYERVAGMTLQVGNVGNRRMAIGDADALRQRMAGSAIAGKTEIMVRMEPGLRAEIIDQSVSAASVKVTSDLQQDTPTSRAAKRLTA